MTRDEIRNKIIEIAAEEIGVEITADSNLKESGLDSLSLVVLVAAIEDVFGITFKEDDLQPENFTTAENLVELTERYL